MRKYARNVTLDPSISNEKSVYRLLNYLEFYYLPRENAELSKSIPIHAKSIRSKPSGSILGFFPLSNADYVWLGDNFRSALSKRLVLPLIMYDNDILGLGRGVRFELTRSKLKKLWAGLNDFPSDQELIIYLDPLRQAVQND